MTNIKALEIINAMVYDFGLCFNTDVLDYSFEDQLEAIKIAKNALTNECNKKED